MTKEELIRLKQDIVDLSKDDEKERDLYLRGLANGDIQGPPVGYPSVDKPWLQYYSEENLLKYPKELNLYEFLKDSSKDIMDNKAISYMGKVGRQLTFRQLFDEVDALAKSFMELGVKKGDIVTVSLANTPEYVTTFYALAKIGAIANLIDPRLKEEKLTSSINEANSKVILYTDLFSENLDKVIDKTSLEKVVIISPFDSLNFVLKHGMKLKKGKISLDRDRYMTWNEFKKLGKNSAKEVNYKVDFEDPVCFVITSGTTGVPKAVVLTHKNFAYMANQGRYCGYEYSENGTFLNQVPTFLGYNIFITVTNPLHSGLHLIMLPDYNPDKFGENITKYKVEGVNAGPADWDNFLSYINNTNKDVSFLKIPISGSDKLDETKKKKIDKAMKEHGSTSRLLEGYGMSEISSAATSNLPQVVVPDSVGVPLRHTIVSIFDPEDENHELTYGEVGEVCFKSNTIMKEYYNNPEETKNALKEHADGVWLHSGDLGYISKDGNLFLKGRIKRVIVNYEGFKITPYDLEKVVMDTGYVDECCVVGVDDLEHGHGSVPVASIVIKNEFLSETEKVLEEIMNASRKKLGDRYQIQDIVVYDELPLTQTGKVNYRLIQNTINENRKSNKEKVLTRK